MKTAGYSGTPLAQKLGIRAGHTVALIDAPADLERLLAPLPDDVDLRTDVRKRPDVVLAFFDHRARLVRRLPALARSIHPSGALWLCWPKKTSGRPTELVEGLVRDIGLDTGLVDNKIAAVSDVWSGLRFVVRLVDR